MPLIILALVLAVLAYLAVGAGRQYLADRAFKPIRIPAPSSPAADVAPVLAGAAAAPGPATSTSGASGLAGSGSAGGQPSAAGVAAALASGLAASDLGPSVAAQVYDAGTGVQLLAQRATELVAPASTAKLLVAAAVLSVHKPTDRFVTKVVAGSVPGSVVLVGGGDPTLSGAAASQLVEYPEAGRISDLAARVHRAVGGTAISRISVDGSLFSGPNTAPGWGSEDAPSSYACPITAAMVDAGRDAPAAAERSADPDLATGNALAASLGALGGSSAGAQVLRGSAPAGARLLGSVRSAPVGVLVEQMLRDSDNVIAEVLTRQVALAVGKPGSFAAGAAAVSAALAPLGVSVGAGMRDGSGLSVTDRVPATALAQVLLQAVGSAHPRLRPMLGGLPVAGWDGTLVDEGRFAGSASAADGLVRAKTGTLTGVSALAGLVTDADGRMLAFAFVADETGNEAPARVAIDDLAATLARCGCH